MSRKLDRSGLTVFRRSTSANYAVPRTACGRHYDNFDGVDTLGDTLQYYLDYDVSALSRPKLFVDALLVIERTRALNVICER